jgi:hypothetical protein
LHTIRMKLVRTPVQGLTAWVSLEYRDFRCRENGPPKLTTSEAGGDPD